MKRGGEMLSRTFVTKSYLKNTSAARFLLFSEDLEAELVDRRVPTRFPPLLLMI